MTVPMVSETGKDSESANRYLGLLNRVGRGSVSAVFLVYKIAFTLACSLPVYSFLEAILQNVLSQHALSFNASGSGFSPLGRTSFFSGFSPYHS